MEFYEKKHVPSVVGAIVRDSLDQLPCSPHITAGDREKWRRALEERWKEAYALAEMWPEALRLLDVIGAEHGFINPQTGRRMRLDRTSSANMSVLA